MARYAGTSAYPTLRRVSRRGAFGLPVAPPLSELREPIRTRTGPGVTVQIMPSGYTLGEMADGYLYLTGGGAGQ